MAETREVWTSAGSVHTGQPKERVERLGARSQALVGDPAALGLLGFGTATFVAASVLAGWWPASAIVGAIPLLFIFGGVVQFAAGMWALAKADTLGATAFGSFGAFNVTFAVFAWMQHTGVIPPTANLGPAGVMVMCFGAIALFMGVAALARNLALVSVLWALAVGYVLVAIGYFAGNPTSGYGVVVIGGWALIVSSGLAFYTAFGIAINSTFGRVVVPLGSTKKPMQELVGNRS